MLRILIVDEQPLFRQILTIHLKNIYSDITIFEAKSIEDAQNILLAYEDISSIYNNFDLIIVGAYDLKIALDYLNYLRDSSSIKICSKSKIILMLCKTQAIKMEEIIKLQISGYVPKAIEVSELYNALYLVLANELYISPYLLNNQSLMIDEPEVDKPIMSIPLTHCNLTRRQQEVLKLIALGLSNKLIASRLGCATGTIKLHVSAILKLLKVHNRTEAAQLAKKILDIE